ncbi:hypothetical protein [Rhodopirellula bahusiensis]|uniref:hypothetical protein n=1 Tax=Rhodopirellula bahusiensis TaxID=2014065 RepID=UPI00329935C6
MYEPDMSHRGDVDSEPPRVSSKMQTSWFDAVTSFLMAVLLMLSSVVGVLFLLWMLLPQDEVVLTEPVAEITRVSRGGGSIVAAPFDTPADQEVVALVTEDLETSVQSLVAAAKQVAMNEPATEPAEGDTAGASDKIGSGGPDDTSGDIVPRFERWQIDWKANDLSEYAKQLDHFQIELGVIGGGRAGVDLVNQFSLNPQSRYLADSEEEKRLYFVWTHRSPLQRFEERLLAQAGVSTHDRHVLKLIPEDLETHLATLEHRHAVKAGHESVGEIARTVFECVPAKRYFEFRVVSQRYR